MSDLVETAKVFISPCEKLIDAISRAIGKAYEPRHIKKMAEAKAYEITTISEAMRNSIDLPVTYNNGELDMNSVDIDEFVRRTAQRISYQELIRQKNIDAVFENAYSILEEETVEESDSDERVDNDWMLRFINSVEDITDEEMQLLWSKVLAGEIKKPRSFSIRTLETLRNLSKEEAIIFQNLCQFMIQQKESTFIPNQDFFMKENAIQFKNIVLMEECGLMNSNSLIVLQKDIGKDEIGIAVSGQIIIVASTKNGKQYSLKIGQYPLTVAGKELYGLVGIETPEKVFLSFANSLKIQNNSLNIRAHKILSNNNGKYRSEKEDLL